MNDKVILALKYFFVSLDLEWKKQKKNIMRMQKNKMKMIKGTQLIGVKPSYNNN